MGWSGGTFTRVHDWTDDAAAGLNIEASRMDAEDDNLATGINTCLTKDGSNAATGNLPMGGNIHTGVGDGTSRTHYPSIGQVQDGGLVYASASGADTIVLNLTPAIAAYAAGQKFTFKAAATNTGATTLNVNSKGAKAIQIAAAPTIAGNIVQNLIYTVVYDGTQFQLTGANIAGLYATAANIQSSGYVTGAVGGTANAVTLVVTPAITSYASGQRFLFQAGATNTGATTINVSSLGAKNVFSNLGACVGGELVASGIYELIYDGTQFQLLNQAVPAAHGCHVYDSVAEVFADGASRAIDCNAEYFDTDTLHSTSVNPERITIPSNLYGLWSFSASISIAPHVSANGTISMVTATGLSAKCASASALVVGNSAVNVSCTGTWQMDASEPYMEVSVLNSTGQDATIQLKNFSATFHGVL